MKALDLFAGIGGFSLAAHWMEWETVAFVEWDAFCQKVLAKNFPNVPIFGDIKEFDGTQYNGTIDLICGGFPCQPFSTAGNRKGKNDDRFLWHEMLRVIKEVKPTWIVGENVAGLLTMENGSILDGILTDLENEGYQTQTFIIPACAVQAPHRRDRIWIVAHSEGFNDRRNAGKFQNPNEQGREKRSQKRNAEFSGTNIESNPDFRESGLQRSQQPGTLEQRKGASQPITELYSDAANTESSECQFAGDSRERRSGFTDSNFSTANTHSEQNNTPNAGRFYTESGVPDWGSHWYEAATKLCGIHDGIPVKLDRNRAKRLKALGNSIVPQVVYEIFKAIEEIEINNKLFCLL